MKIIWAALIILLLHASVQAADKIRVAIPPGVHSYIPLAQKKGFFKEEGLDAEVIEMRSLAVAIAALANGEIDYFSVIGPSVTAALRGLPIKVVACFIPCSPVILIARPEFKEVQQLKAKTVGFGEVGGGRDVVGRMLLRHFGIAEKEMKFISSGPNETSFAAMKQGLIAAAIVAPLWALEGEKLGFNVLANACELFSWPTAGLVTTAKKIKERPDEIKRVIKAAIKGARYILQNREGYIQFLMEWQKIDREIATGTYEYLPKAYNDDGSLPEKGFRLVIEEAKKLAKVDREVSLSEVAELSILKEAQKELGIKGK
jgi:ABC-type nitrate/sulfonate/bicarbonate transport system substrate-binding protein